MPGSGRPQPPDRELRGQTFDAAAELYDRRRPAYPPQLFADLADTADLRPGSRVLEVGTGTALASTPLARRGCRITGIEPGPGLAAIARRNLAPCDPSGRPGEVIEARFEDWALPGEPFDLVLAATSWHWIDPDVRAAKSADALRPGGTLAIVATHHVAGGSDALFADLQRCYERRVPDTPPGRRLPAGSEIPADDAEVDRSGRFDPARCARYDWEVTYSTAQYLELLTTYSSHLTLTPGTRAALFGDLTAAIDSAGGQITKRYLACVTTARRSGA